MAALATLTSRECTEILSSDELCLATARNYESISRDVAKNLNRREEIIDIHNGGNLDGAGHLWRVLSLSFDLSSKVDSAGYALEDSRIELALASAKLERNLIAGLQKMQNDAIKHEADVRRLIFNITTFHRIEDPRFFNLHAVLTQLLSNLISPVDARPVSGHFADQFLRQYTSGRREDDVIIRLLDSKNSKTIEAVLRLLNNTTRRSPERLTTLLDFEAGIKWLAKILNRMEDWLQDETDPAFELSSDLLHSFIYYNLHSKLFDALGEHPEPITPSQTLLLKVLDSNLQAAESLDDVPPPQGSLYGFLVGVFQELVRHALPPMDKRVDDPRLPKYLEAIVLLAECMSAIGLRVQKRRDTAALAGVAESEGAGVHKGGEEVLVDMMKNEDLGIIKPLIDLLKSLTVFFPRSNPHHPITDPTEIPPAMKPFNMLKRDLLRLMSVLTFEDKSVGDQIRVQGGIEVVLGMTEVDESNPFLREHALFCIRNLMLNNPANQAVIQRMDPVGVLSDTGELLPVPDKMKTKRMGE